MATSFARSFIALAASVILTPAVALAAPPTKEDFRHCNEKANGGGKHVLSQFCFAALGQNPSSLQAGGLSPSPNVKRAVGAAEGLRQVRGTLADHRARGPSYLTPITAGTASMRAQSFA